MPGEDFVAETDDYGVAYMIRMGAGLTGASDLEEAAMSIGSTGFSDDEKLLTRRQLAEYLTNEAGYPIAFSQLQKLCMPSRGEGPPIECWFNGRPLYRPSRGLAWARARSQQQVERPRGPGRGKTVVSPEKTVS